jgi:hypothetical protein
MPEDDYAGVVILIKHLRLCILLSGMVPRRLRKRSLGKSKLYRLGYIIDISVSSVYLKPRLGAVSLQKE